MNKWLWIFILNSLISLLYPAASQAGVTATLSPDKELYTGSCPADISFRGSITSDKPGKVQYRLVRSDGAMQPVETIDFASPGTRDIVSVWRTDEKGLPLRDGWMKVRIVYPEEAESNRANFRLMCDRTMSDLTVQIKKCPKSVKQGHELGSSFRVTAANLGMTEVKDASVDIVIEKEISCSAHAPSPVFSPHYSNGVQLKGGHEQINLLPGQKMELKLGGLNTIPVDTPTGEYFLCAVISAKDSAREGNKVNNCSCCPIKIVTAAGRPDLVIEHFGFKGWGKCESNSPIFTFEVTVANIGTAASPAMPDKALVQVMDLHGNGWGASAGLNSIPPGGSQTVIIPVYYFSEDSAHMTKVVPHPFRATVDPLHLIEELNESNNKSDIIYLDPGLVCSK